MGTHQEDTEMLTTFADCGSSAC